MIVEQWSLHQTRVLRAKSHREVFYPPPMIIPTASSPELGQTTKQLLYGRRGSVDTRSHQACY